MRLIKLLAAGLVMASMHPVEVVAMPKGLSAGCQKAYEEYLSQKGPKAFAKGVGYGCGWASRPKGTLEEAKRSALAYCRKHGMGCRVFESSRR